MQVTNTWMYVFSSKFEFVELTWGRKGEGEIQVPVYNGYI